MTRDEEAAEEEHVSQESKEYVNIHRVMLLETRRKWRALTALFAGIIFLPFSCDKHLIYSNL